MAKKFCDLREGDKLYVLRLNQIDSWTLNEPFRHMEDGSWRAYVDTDSEWDDGRRFIGKTHYTKEAAPQLGYFANREAAERERNKRLKRMKPKPVKAGVWISTQKALPENHDWILFYTDQIGDGIMFGYFDVDNGDKDFDGSNKFYAMKENEKNFFYAVNEPYGQFDIDEVSYWMKIPELKL